MQQAGQVPYLDQNDAHEQSLGQSDGSLPGPEQTLNQSINQSIYRKWLFQAQHAAMEAMGMLPTGFCLPQTAIHQQTLKNNQNARSAL